MADKFLAVTPTTIARKEVRCFVVVAHNNLDVPLSNPIEKFSLEIHTIAEPQDVDGNMVAPRESLPMLRIPMAEAMERTYTVDGLTATGAHILALFNEVIDTYKSPNQETAEQETPLNG